MKERALTFGSAARLVGILTEADRVASSSERPAVILLNSGLIHRVAPNRLYVRLARELARQGHDCLRFDFSGIGDSSVRTDSLPVEDSGIAEAREAMDFLHELRGYRQFILLGLCGGGYFSFRTASRDSRVVGLALLNVRGHLHGGDPDHGKQLEEQAHARHYRRMAVARSYRYKNLLKMLRGSFDVRVAAKSLLRRSREPDEATASFDRCGQDFDRLRERGVRILSIYSEGDWSLDYLVAALGPQAADRLSRPGSRFELLAATNHVFSVGWSQDHVVRTVADWIATTPWGEKARGASPDVAYARPIS